MRTVLRRVASRLRADESGQGLVEYGLLAVLIALAVVATLTVLGGQLNAKFNEVKACLDGSNPNC